MDTNRLMLALYKVWLILAWLFVAMSFHQSVEAAVYGVKDSIGKMRPKIDISIDADRIIISKLYPHEKFPPLFLALNGCNQDLMREINNLRIQRIEQGAKLGEELPLSGKQPYELGIVHLGDMSNSIGIRIINKGDPSLFKGRRPSDLFTIYIGGRPCGPVGVVADYESSKFLDLSRYSLEITSKNLESGIILNITNKLDKDLNIGVSMPLEGMLYSNIVRKITRKKVPRDEWDRIRLEKSQGIFIALIPEPESAQLRKLHLKQITIRVWDGQMIQETIRIPIKVSAELLKRPVKSR